MRSYIDESERQYFIFEYLSLSFLISDCQKFSVNGSFLRIERVFFKSLSISFEMDFISSGDIYQSYDARIGGYGYGYKKY